MDFKKIAEQYPKAWGKLREYAIKNYGAISEFMTETSIIVYWIENTRNLYNFFDSKGIVIDCSIDKEEGNWAFDIFLKDKSPYPAEQYYCEFARYYDDKPQIFSRPEAETEAFTKAFEILNNQLRKE